MREWNKIWICLYFIVKGLCYFICRFAAPVWTKWRFFLPVVPFEGYLKVGSEGEMSSISEGALKKKGRKSHQKKINIILGSNDKDRSRNIFPFVSFPHFSDLSSPSFPLLSLTPSSTWRLNRASYLVTGGLFSYPPTKMTLFHTTGLILFHSFLPHTHTRSSHTITIILNVQQLVHKCDVSNRIRIRLTVLTVLNSACLVT